MSDLLLSPCCEPGWLLIEEGIDPAREHEIESILAIANGYLGVRASIAEDGRFSHPSTFIAGISNASANDAGISTRVLWRRDDIIEFQSDGGDHLSDVHLGDDRVRCRHGSL
jgi:hypothetical protein